MFGYVRPCQSELKCRDFDLYRATYCGLCRCMRQRYGMVAPMLLNYDFTFLALLLWDAEDSPALCTGRCHGNLLRKKTMCQPSEALDIAADHSIILSYWKVRDGVADKGFWPSLGYRALSILLRPSYRKAAKLRPDFDSTVRRCLAELSELEKNQCQSIDRTADTFARILQGAAPSTQNQNQDRALEELLYHVGRWIYLVDAQDDLSEDKISGSYNPIALRFGGEGDDTSMELTLNHSLNLARSALHLGDFGCRQPLLENILYLGLPLVQQAVFQGQFQEIKKQKLWSK